MTESTAHALLDAAEAAFAREGVEHVSLRAIMRAAGANPAAVHYHFGSREALAEAVLDRLLEPLQARRTALLEAAVADCHGQVPLRRLLDALVRPDLELALDVDDRNPGAAGIVGAIYTQPADFVRARVEASFAPVAERFLPHLAAGLPQLAHEEIAWRVRWVIFGTLGALLSETTGELDEQRLEPLAARLVTALAGALAAPAPPRPAKEAST